MRELLCQAARSIGEVQMVEIVKGREGGSGGEERRRREKAERQMCRESEYGGTKGKVVLRKECEMGA
ncbi:hypothetical protein E2C01_069987 [Portunus trituberculatus]|uniref:Uncharacterized protein n=1 Tax=Portunus trituberculatus TaxID=210409 RepID=A0A5B7I2C8_PORTR|nr:hypothetical protein [Portunus trituberculatus]